MRKVFVLVLVLVGLAAAGCATVDTGKFPRMGVDFAFDQKHSCQGMSPEIRLANVPARVTSFEVRI